VWTFLKKIKNKNNKNQLLHMRTNGLPNESFNFLTFLIIKKNHPSLVVGHINK